jgi:hypothetical protein
MSCKGVDWIHLPEDTAQKWELLNTRIKLTFHKRYCIY